MTIDGLTDYMDIYKTQTSDTASKVEKQLGADYSKATDEELMDACKQFEAYFVEQMYKAMMKTVPESESTSSYTSGLTDMYKDNLIKEYASETTEQGSLGLAQMLYEQMKRNYGL